MGFLLKAISSEVTNFTILETGIIGIAWLTIARNIGMISLSLALESTSLEPPPLLAPWWCSSSA